MQCCSLVANWIIFPQHFSAWLPLIPLSPSWLRWEFPVVFFRIHILEPVTTWKFNARELARRNTHSVPKDKGRCLTPQQLCIFETNNTHSVPNEKGQCLFPTIFVSLKQRTSTMC